MMLKKSGKRGHLCIVPDLREKASSLSLLKYDTSCKLFVDILCQVEKVSLYS